MNKIIIYTGTTISGFVVGWFGMRFINNRARKDFEQDQAQTQALLKEAIATLQQATELSRQTTERILQAEVNAKPNLRIVPPENLS
jgi:hypothetical protein